MRNFDFSGFCYVQGYCSVALIHVNKHIHRLAPSFLESISRASGRFPGGIRYELSHDLKRNPIFQFISANKGYFAVLWKKEIPTEISYLAQTKLEGNCSPPLPTHQFLLKTFFTCSKNRKNSIFFSMYRPGPYPCNLRVKVLICQKNNFFLQRFI